MSKIYFLALRLNVFVYIVVPVSPSSETTMNSNQGVFISLYTMNVFLSQSDKKEQVRLKGLKYLAFI